MKQHNFILKKLEVGLMPRVRVGTTSRTGARVPLPYKLMMIEWVDSSRVGEGWIDLADIPAPDPSRYVSVGFLFSENAKGKIIVPTVADVARGNNRHTHGGIMIPTCSILPERRLA